MPKLSLTTLARGARQFVVHEALETTLRSSAVAWTTLQGPPRADHFKLSENCSSVSGGFDRILGGFGWHRFSVDPSRKSLDPSVG